MHIFSSIPWVAFYSVDGVLGCTKGLNSVSRHCRNQASKISNYLNTVRTFLVSYWRRKWQPTPVLLPGKSPGWRCLVGYSPCGCKESDTTERLHFHFLSLFLRQRLNFLTVILEFLKVVSSIGPMISL